MRHYSAVSAAVLKVLPRLSRFPDAIVVNSEEGRRFHQSLGYKPNRWETIPNGIDLQEFKPDPTARACVRSELGVGDSAVLVGMIARFDPMKDHQNFLAAAERIGVIRPEARFILAGRGVDNRNPALASIVCSKGLGGRVRLLGERADVARIAAALDVSCSSSAFGEGFPNAVGEAMACGVPCVVTDVGDSSLLVGATGRTVPSSDPDVLARAVIELLEMSPEERCKLGLEARRRIEERFALPAVIARYEFVYDQLAALGFGAGRRRHPANPATSI